MPKFKFFKIARLIRFYKKAVYLDPNYARGHKILGDLYKAQGELKEAEEYYKRAIQISPNYVNIYYSLGEIFEVQGRHDDAEEYYKKAADLGPAYFHARNVLKTEWPKAEEYIKKDECPL